MAIYQLNKNQPTIKNKTTVTNGIFKNITQYFYSIGYIDKENFSKAMKLIFKPLIYIGVDETFIPLISEGISLTGSVIDNLKVDMPQGNWFSEVSFELETAFLNYYKTLFKEIAKYNGGDFGGFYSAVCVGFEHLKNNVTRRLVGKEERIEYFHQYIEKLTSTYSKDNDQDCLFSETLYAIVYFLSTGNIFTDISDKIFHPNDDWTEYLERVVKPYSANSLPGTYAIYSLCKEGNVCALHEAYCINFYGRIGGRKNYVRAYEFCHRAAFSESGTINPVALWDMAEYLFYYKNTKYPNNPLSYITIPQIENNSDWRKSQDRKLQALYYARTSYECGCIAAANLLGIILSDDEIPSILKKDFLSPEKYWIIAANKDYFYAHNNLYLYYQELAEKESDESEKQNYIKESLSHLKKAASLFEPWSCNKYALILFSQDHKQEAYEYWMQAFECYYGWAAYNLLEKFYLPASNGKATFVYLDDSVSVQLLVDVCMNCDITEIIERTENLLEEKPELN